MVESYYKYVKSSDASKHEHPLHTWAVDGVYEVGDWIWHNGSSYQVKVAHTATAETEPGGSIDGFFTFTYIAYAEDDQGTGFTRTFDESLDYIGIINTDTRIGSPVASDFAGLWKHYKGGSGNWVYVAYASADDGTDFTLTFDPDLDYLAILVSNVAIPSPIASNFTGIWKLYKGQPGTPGSYMYVAYASDATGTGFTLTFDADLDYIAILRSDIEIVAPDANDFTDLWKNYKGAQGDSSDFVYVAYASSDAGAGFTQTFDADLDYVAILISSVAIPSPVVGDFVGLWKNYKGETGPSAYVYIAYAYDAAGTGFTNTFNASLDYIAILATTTEIPSPVVGDFTGLWKNYRGAQGERGFTAKGAWASDVTYAQFDAAGYGNCTWLSLKDEANLNHTPEEGVWWTLIISGAGVSNHRVYSAIPTPAPDGEVSVFTAKESFVSGSEKVKLNGLEQLRDTDYTTDPSSGEITWIGTPLPPTGSVIIVDYDHDDVMRTSNTLLHGSGAPSDANDGIDGDFYRDEVAQLEYGPKSAGAWPAGYLYVAGASAFVYIAYASDDSGTDFTLTFDPDLKYVAILSTDTEIPAPIVTDFAELWTKYMGDPGTGINITGPWDDEVTYAKADQVSFEGDSWVSMKGTNLNHEPAEGEWWTILAEKGASGGDVTMARWWFGS